MVARQTLRMRREKAGAFSNNSSCADIASKCWLVPPESLALNKHSTTKHISNALATRSTGSTQPLLPRVFCLVISSPTSFPTRHGTPTAAIGLAMTLRSLKPRASNHCRRSTLRLNAMIAGGARHGIRVLRKNQTVPIHAEADARRLTMYCCMRPWRNERNRCAKAASDHKICVLL
ncbi:hypothetical protein PTRG_10555 [Pyrenophora tritici-repentis Pt-1C-BFP]|uniref:Uncharacterized protein n=1 Tax=Pyrenophora tritici-repentis (strain Pt-1C-BFP) TaxID=426418 RepID=B2WKP5_PYRTR|nr:uncharacterized protein PTRG_10555 [Pyrenophora tritici-repentis Pt-1C-BFP]EDU43605.1 hypothetical protein PTRG_10555 [Pyrenophora tritici-repentis Pt-1C-BFP]